MYHRRLILLSLDVLNEHSLSILENYLLLANNKLAYLIATQPIEGSKHKEKKLIFFLLLPIFKSKFSSFFLQIKKLPLLQV